MIKNQQLSNGHVYSIDLIYDYMLTLAYQMRLELYEKRIKCSKSSGKAKCFFVKFVGYDFSITSRSVSGCFWVLCSI